MADEIKSKPTVEESNSELLKRVTAGITKFNQGVISNIEKAKKNPANDPIETAIFDRMIEARNKHLPWLIEESYKVAEFESKQNVDKTATPSQKNSAGYIIENSGILLSQFEEKVKDDVKSSGISGMSSEHFNKQVNSAFAAVDRELPKNGPGLLGTMGKAFFDPDKDGIRWGGVLGLIGGVVAGVWMGGGLEGGILGIVALAVLAIGGVMLGNFVSDAYSDKKEPEQVKGQEKSLKRDTAPKVEKKKELNSQIVELDPSGTTTLYIDKDGKNVPISQGVPANIAELMQIKINSEAGKGLASVAEVALIDKSDGEARPVKMSPKSPVNFKVQKNESNGSYIELGEESVQADLKNLRESVEEEMKKSKGGNAESLEQRKDVKTEKTAETSGQPFEDISLKGYVASEDYKEQRAKEQADELKKKSGGSGVTLTPDGATNHSIPNVLLEFARANTQGK